MRLVIVESPFAGDIEKNLRYLRACLRDCLKRGEAPFASHAIYTQPGVLDDGDPAERKHGIEAGFEWRKVSEATVVYTDLGITTGMQYGIEAHVKLVTEEYKRGDQRREIEYRKLGCDWESAAWATEDDFATKWPKAIDDNDKIELIEGVFTVLGEGKWDPAHDGDITEAAVLMLEHVEALPVQS